MWQAARADLEAAGATVIEVDFPAVSNYEGDRAGAPTIATRGLVSPEALHHEIIDLCAWAFDDFLRANGDPAIPNLAVVDGPQIWPKPADELPDRYDGFEGDITEYPDHVRQHPVASMREIPELESLVRGLEETGRRDVDEWMDARGLDAVVFPRWLMWPGRHGPQPGLRRSGVAQRGVVANGNLAIRHLGFRRSRADGIDGRYRMPVGLTFAGCRGDDVTVLRLAAAFDALGPRRVPPAGLKGLASQVYTGKAGAPPRAPASPTTSTVRLGELLGQVRRQQFVAVELAGEVPEPWAMPRRSMA